MLPGLVATKTNLEVCFEEKHGHVVRPHLARPRDVHRSGNQVACQSSKYHLLMNRCPPIIQARREALLEQP